MSAPSAALPTTKWKEGMTASRCRKRSSCATTPATSCRWPGAQSCLLGLCGCGLLRNHVAYQVEFQHRRACRLPCDLREGFAGEEPEPCRLGARAQAAQS